MSRTAADSDNPMGTDGFEFVEYTAPDPARLAVLFRQLGFRAVARHRSKNVTLHRQGGVPNAEPNSAGEAQRPVDGTSAGSPRLLLQIFTENAIGAIFFELIERRGDSGFGEGNFRALFVAMEEDQLRRGVLPAKA